MARWTFFGKLHPERVPISSGQSHRGKATVSTLGLDFEFRIELHASQLILDINVLSGNADIGTLKNLATSLARGLAHIIGYRVGGHFDAEIVSAIDRDSDDWRVFGVEIPVVADKRRRERTGERIEVRTALFMAVGQSTAAQMALDDFTSAMLRPTDTGFYCYRAIEAMMQSMKSGPTDTNDGPAWERLRTDLRVERAVIAVVQKHAEMPRHGKPTGMSDADRATVLDLTDRIIERFLAYLLAGKQALSESDFPTLRLATLGAP